MVLGKFHTGGSTIFQSIFILFIYIKLTSLTFQWHSYITVQENNVQDGDIKCIIDPTSKVQKGVGTSCHLFQPSTCGT